MSTSKNSIHINQFGLSLVAAFLVSTGCQQLIAKEANEDTEVWSRN